MERNEPSPARLREVWLAQRLLAERTDRLAAELGISVDEVARQAAEYGDAQVPPARRPGRPNEWPQRLGYARDERGPVPFHLSHRTMALRVAIEAALDPTARKIDLCRKIVNAHASPDLAPADRERTALAFKDSVKASAPRQRADGRRSPRVVPNQ